MGGQRPNSYRGPGVTLPSFPTHILVSIPCGLSEADPRVARVSPELLLKAEAREDDFPYFLSFEGGQSKKSL